MQTLPQLKQLKRAPMLQSVFMRYARLQLELTPPVQLEPQLLQRIQYTITKVIDRGTAVAAAQYGKQADELRPLVTRAAQLVARTFYPTKLRQIYPDIDELLG